MREPPIDVLINNAGALYGTRQLTDDGLEYTFALNHMSYFVVTEGLREQLLAAGAARIISTASAAHQGATLDFDDFQFAKSYRAMRAYSCLEALQHPIYARTCSAPARHQGDGELSASWLRRDTLRRRKRRFNLAHGLACQVFCHNPRRRRSNDHLSRLFARGGQCDWKIFLQVSSNYAFASGVGRPCCFWPCGSAVRLWRVSRNRWGNRPAILWIAEDFGCCASG